MLNLKQGRSIVLLSLITVLLSACVGNLWTGASLIYDRHHLYKKVSDYKLYIQTCNALYSDKALKQPGAVIDIAVFNGDILIVGHLPTAVSLETAKQRLRPLKNYRRLFNELILKAAPEKSAEDAWITAKVRAQIVADSSIDPNAFKVLTVDGIVYVMGDVKHEEALKVVNIVRHTRGVRRVVKVMKYFVYQ